jgi:hypothetical protein
MGADRGYFVRISSPPGVTQTMPGVRTGPDGDGQRPQRRRRRHIHIPIGVVIVVLVGGWFVWAQVHEGGARKQIQAAIDDARGAVEKATTDPGLKRAALFFNQQYARDGHYTQITEADQRDADGGDWGVGVTVNYCNGQALVLHSLTGAGTLSRLLYRGEDLGDALGEHACPSDYANPVPWSLKPSG